MPQYTLFSAAPSVEPTTEATTANGETPPVATNGRVHPRLSHLHKVAQKSNKVINPSIDASGEKTFYGEAEERKNRKMNEDSDCEGAHEKKHRDLGDRKASTGTLNRLILVAQALENEMDSRRQTDISGSKVVFSLRMANLVLLLLVNALIFTGVGQYHDAKNGGHKSLMLTADKWFFEDGTSTDLPSTFREMRLSGQFLAAAITLSMLIATVVLQAMHVCHVSSSRVLCMCYSFGAVPFSLFVFGLEMHYSACPWLDDYYRILLETKKDFSQTETLAETQCGINGWALAGIFSLLSCGLFVSEGLISAFFRTDAQPSGDKNETLL